MSQYLQYNDPLKIIWRKGTVDDPYVDKTDSLKIINNQIVLSEIPDGFNHVEISGYTEIYKGNPLSNEFKVNYRNGIVTFNSIEEGKTITASYKGRGQILYPAERIYLHNENPDIIETLQEIIDNGQEAIYAVGGLQGKIDEASTLETSLEGDITTATNIKSDLDTSIGNADTTKINLDSSIANANTTKTDLDGSIAIAQTTKTELDNSIAQGDLSNYALKTELHAHGNITVLGSLSDVAGELHYNDTLISSANHTHAKTDITDFSHIHTEAEISDLQNYSLSTHTHHTIDNDLALNDYMIKLRDNADSSHYLQYQLYENDGNTFVDGVRIAGYDSVEIYRTANNIQLGKFTSSGLKVLGNTVWHEGNFDPSIKANSTIVNSHLAEKAKYQTATGSDAITVTTGGNFGLTQGNWVKWIQASTNTGAVTINVDSKGIKALKNADGTDLVAGDLEAGNPYEAFYSLGDDFFILRPRGAKLDGIIAAIESWGGVVSAPQKAADVETAINNVASWDADLVSTNILSGKNILGVVGSVQPITSAITKIVTGFDLKGIGAVPGVSGGEQPYYHTMPQSVDWNRSVLIAPVHNASPWSSRWVLAYPYSSNTLHFHNVYDPPQYIFFAIGYTVLEFDASLVKNTKHGYGTKATTGDYMDVPLGFTVDPAKTLVSINGTSYGAHAETEADRANASYEIINGDTLRIYIQTYQNTGVGYSLIEFL